MKSLTTVVSLPLRRLKGSQNHSTAAKRDQYCWESEEMRVVGLDQVGRWDGKENKEISLLHLQTE